MKFLERYHETLYKEGESFWFKVLIIGFMNFFTFVIAGLVYFIPIDLTWRIIGQAPAILLGAVCLYIYSTFFAIFLIVSTSNGK